MRLPSSTDRKRHRRRSSIRPQPVRANRQLLGAARRRGKGGYASCTSGGTNHFFAVREETGHSFRKSEACANSVDDSGIAKELYRRTLRSASDGPSMGAESNFCARPGPEPKMDSRAAPCVGMGKQRTPYQDGGTAWCAGKMRSEGLR